MPEPRPLMREAMNAGREGICKRIPFCEPQHDRSSVSYCHRPVLLPARKLSYKGESY